MRKKIWLLDVLFFTLAFFGLAALILLVNVITNTWNETSGHALATIMTGLMLFRYRWSNTAPDRNTVMAFSAIAGFSAIVYLYFLEIFASISGWFAFEALRAYELVIAFAANTLVFSVTVRVRKRSAVNQQ